MLMELIRATTVGLLLSFVLGIALAAPDPQDSQRDESETEPLEVPAPPVVIEGELPSLGPSVDDLMRHFRESLKAPPSFLYSERTLADGSLEATTRYGRFCSPPLPAPPGSGAGGDVRLFARCASF
jgi:hypothetical protein